MSQHSVLEANGLHTTGSPLSAVPRGSLRKADNVVIRAKDVLEPRRGQKTNGYTFGAAPYRANEVFFWGDVGAGELPTAAVIHADESRLYLDNSVSFSEYAGSYAPPDPYLLRMKFELFDKRLYFVTSLGMKVLDGINDVPRTAGIRKPFNVEVSTDVYDAGAATPNWLADDEAVGIRVLFCRRDANNRVTLGPPSEQARVLNESGAGRAVRVVAGIPAGITSAYFVRIYMTDTVAVTEAIGDEHWLLYEGRLTSAEITAGVVTKDITNVEAVLSDVALYTNPNSGGGIEVAKLPPPWAKDVCRFGRRLWAFNIRRRHSLTLTLLGVDTASGGTGLYELDTNTVTLNDLTYIFGPSASGATGTIDASGFCRVVIESAGSASSNITETSKAFVQAINSFDADVRAYFVAREDGWPGEIVIEETEIGGAVFSAYGSPDAASAFSPNLLEIQFSTNGAEEHGYACSDIDEPESWPLYNYGTAGNKGSAILRGLPLRDGVYCLTSDGTAQTISGSAPPFRVDELDSTTKLVGPDTACVLNNQIWALTAQGVCTISEAGVGIVGLPVEADIRALLRPTITAFISLLETTKQRSFGFAYESERTYGLWVPTLGGESSATQGFLYNYATKTWVRWPLARTCGRVDPLRDFLHMGSAVANTTIVERKTLTSDDYADDETTVAYSAVSGKTFTVTSTTGIEVGDVVELGYARSVVAEVTDATTLKVATTEEWAASGTLTVYKAFAVDVEWVPTALGSPGLLKSISDFTLHFWELACAKAEAWLTTDLSFTWSRTKSMARTGYGTSEWGAVYGDPAGPYNERMGVAGQKHSATFIMPRFTIREAFAGWKLLGYTLEHEPSSERTKK